MTNQELAAMIADHLFSDGVNGILCDRLVLEKNKTLIGGWCVSAARDAILDVLNNHPRSMPHLVSAFTRTSDIEWQKAFAVESIEARWYRAGRGDMAKELALLLSRNEIDLNETQTP